MATPELFLQLRYAVLDANPQEVSSILQSVRLDLYFLAYFLIGQSEGSMVSAPVFVAVKAGHLEVVRELFTFLCKWMEFPNPIPYPNGRHKLYWFQELVLWAARWGHASIVKFLVPQYQRLFECQRSIESHINKLLALALRLVAFHGHLDVLKLILEWEKEDHTLPNLALIEQVLLPSKAGLTALHLAAQSGLVGAVELLVNLAKMDEIKAKMDGIKGSDPECFTPLHLAASFGHVKVVEFLLIAYEDSLLLAQDCLGRTALHYAAREGHVHVVRALVDAHRAIALVPDYDGLLALHVAARAGHAEIIRALNPFGGIMCEANHSYAVKRCVEVEYTWNLKEDSLPRRTRYECSLLFYPGMEWEFPRVKLFDSLFWRTKGFTPLHFAARYGYEAAVEELLKNRDAGRALALHDSGGFLAYDWMKVHGKGDAFVASCVTVEKSSSIASEMSSSIASEIQEGKQATEELQRAWQSGDLELMKCELEKRSGWSSRITSDVSAIMASDISKEKQAVEELQRGWQRGIDGIEEAIDRMPVFQWLLEDEEVVDAPWHELISSSTVRPYGLGALHQALGKANFTAAKQIILHYPGAHLSVDAARVHSRVQKTLSNFGETVYILYSRSEHRRSLEEFLISLVTREELASAVDALRWLAGWAKENEFTSLLGMLIDKGELKRGLYEDRQLYVDCANAMLVGATLIVGVAFQGWLQPPLGYSYEYQGSEYADVHERAVRAFWWFNNGSFFFAVASLIAGAKGAVPVRHTTDLVSSLEKVRRAVGVASPFLSMALVCVVGAFSAAGFAVLPPLESDLLIMQTCVLCGCSFCALALLWFGLGVLPLVTETIRYMAPRLKDFLLVCVFFIPYILLRLVFRLVGSLIREFPLNRPSNRCAIHLQTGPVRILLGARYRYDALKSRVVTRVAGVVKGTMKDSPNKYLNEQYTGNEDFDN